MSDKIYFGLSEPTDWSREEEWNRWYTTMHQPDLTATRGMIQHQRYLNLLPGFSPCQSKYAVLYHFDTNDFADSMIHMCVDIDQKTIAEGRHIDWHTGRGDSFCGVEVTPLKAASQPHSYPRGAVPQGLEILAQRFKAHAANDIPPVYEAQDLGRVNSRYQPPVLPKGLVVLFLSCQSPARGKELQEWAATAWPGIRHYTKFAIGRTDHCLFHEISGADLMAEAARFFAQIEALSSQGRCFDDAVGYAYVVQEIDPNGFEPLARNDYSTDQALFPYIADGTIDAMVKMLREA